MKLFPFINQKVKLKTTDKQFIQTLKALTEEGFDPGRTQEESDTLFVSDFTKQYEAEIFTNSFRARRLNKSGYQGKGAFIKNTIYGKLTQEGEMLTFRYIIIPNILTSIFFIAIMIGTPYLFYDTVFVSKDGDFRMWFAILVPYPVFMLTFNIDATDNEKFIDKLIARTPHE
ncbi:MAG: hypothetical protein ACXVPU_05210 [Bacteroidia bacterium]